MRSVTRSLVPLIALAGTAVADDREPSDAVIASVGSAQFAPFSDSPANTASVVKVLGAYDGARNRSLVSVEPIATLTPWLQVEARLEYEPDGSSLDREFSAGLGILDEGKHGIDLQLTGGYASAGLNDVAAAIAGVAIGHSAAGGYVFGTARLDVGLGAEDGRERGLELAVASSRPLSAALFAGFDTQLRLDLERDMLEPEDESTWSLQSGPYVGYAASHFTVTGSVGVAADKPRMESRDVGVFGAVGLAAAF